MGTLTLGSLFDGSGGFCLGGILAGIKPVWQSEIEPFPIRVTTKRLPFVKHYGDVNTLDGGELEPVDIITFGSPCTDLSIAGKRAGLEGSQSGLFHQAVRIIKEMREKTNGIYPRFIVWENVPGAFSSHGGDDFQKVLEEICGICDDSVSVPGSAKWEPAGCILGDGFSVAWRVLDADAWGVPQRRKRIYLVGHLTGHCAGKILFESEGVSGYSAEGFRSWQRTACRVEGGAGEAGGTICLNDQGGVVMSVTEDVTCTLRAEAHHPPVVMSAGFCTEHSAKAGNIGYEAETAPTLRAGVVPATVYENHSQDTRYTGPVETAPTVLSGGLEVLTATTLSGVTNRYEGLASVIRDNLTLESRTYVRIKGGTSSSHATLKVGPVDSSAANQRPVVTIKGTSGFYGQYRNSNGFLDEADGDQKSSYLDTVIGENGGSALFLVQAIGSGFGGNIRRHGLWLDYVYVSPNATSDGDTIDILQVDAGGDASIMNIEQENDKPARLVFNGGTFTRRYECRRNQSTDNPFKASAGKKLIVSGINGNPINITKLYQTFSLVAGAGTVRFETDGGDLRLGSVGGAWGNNFLEWGVPASVDIEWGVKGDIVLYENCWLKLNAENQLPYGPGSGGLVVTSQSASTYAFLDLNGHTARLNSLRMFGQWACVSNKTQSVKGSKIVFGAGDTDGLLNGRVCAGIDIEKVGNGLLVVSNATVEGTMTVKAGRVMFVGANTFATPVVFEDGTTLVRRRDDSTDSIARLSKTGESSVSYTGTPHDICIKQGSDTVNAYAGAYLDGTELSVEEGILRFTGTTSDKWWRLTVRKALNHYSIPNQNSSYELNVLALWPTNVMSSYNLSKGNMKTTNPWGTKRMLTYGLTTNTTEFTSSMTSYSDMATMSALQVRGQKSTRARKAAGSM